MSFTSARRDVRIIAAAKSASWLGDEVALVALTLRIQGEGRGAAAVAALLMANLLPIVLLSGVVGRIVDRYDNRMLLMASSALQAALCAGVAFVSTPPAVLGLMVLLGAGQAVNSASWQALLPSVVPPAELPRALGTVQVCTTVAGIAAPALGGLLTGLYGARIPLLLDAASFVAVLGAAVAIRSRRVLDAPARGTARSGGLAIVRRDALLAPLFLLVATFVLLASMVNVVDVFLVREVLHASTTWYGAVGACMAVGMLAGGLAARRLSGTDQLARGFVVSTVMLSVGLAGHGLVPSIGWVPPLSLLVGLGNGVLNVTLSALVMTRSAAAERGRVGALLNGVVSGMQIFAFAAGGALAAVLSPRVLFVAAGLLGLLAPVVLGRRVVVAARTDEGADSVGMEPLVTAAAA